MKFEDEYLLAKSFQRLRESNPDRWELGEALAHSDFEVASQLDPYPRSRLEQEEYIAIRVRRTMNGWRRQFARQLGYANALTPGVEEAVAAIGMAMGIQLRSLFRRYRGPKPKARPLGALKRPAEATVVRAAFKCSVCGALDTVIDLVPPGVAHPDSMGLDIISSPRVAHGFSGERMVSIKMENFDWIANLLRRADPQEIYDWRYQLMPFYCRICSRVFCTDHISDRAHLQHAASLPE